MAHLSTLKDSADRREQEVIDAAASKKVMLFIETF